ncbi:unnamed protein product [Urochloa humidicola]
MPADAARKTMPGGGAAGRGAARRRREIERGAGQREELRRLQIAAPAAERMPARLTAGDEDGLDQPAAAAPTPAPPRPATTNQRRQLVSSAKARLHTGLRGFHHCASPAAGAAAAERPAARHSQCLLLASDCAACSDLDH